MNKEKLLVMLATSWQWQGVWPWPWPNRASLGELVIQTLAGVVLPHMAGHQMNVKFVNTVWMYPETHFLLEILWKHRMAPTFMSWRRLVLVFWSFCNMEPPVPGISSSLVQYCIYTSFDEEKQLFVCLFCSYQPQILEISIIGPFSQ